MQEKYDPTERLTGIIKVPAPTHDLPSKADPLAHFTAFYHTAIFNKDGSVSVTFKVPAENKQGIVDLSYQDGKALNVTVWETLLPAGMEDLARAAGLGEPT